MIASLAGELRFDACCPEAFEEFGQFGVDGDAAGLDLLVEGRGGVFHG
ncbi:Uncharacterised protein [Mycobacteroides abscessus subsp. abscessus]|nr:Uncharacterised protein [Mycobacteroides abscessus subsp. abscessus]